MYFLTATGVCVCVVCYLGTVSSPLANFSGLQRTVMTELRPWSQEAVAFLDLQHFTVRSVCPCDSAFFQWLVPVEEVDIWKVSGAGREEFWLRLHAVQRCLHRRTCVGLRAS